MTTSKAPARGAQDLPAWVRRSWLVPLVIGLLLAIMGVVLLVNPRAGVETLRWLVVISLLFAAVEAFATASVGERTWVGWVVGGAFLLGAVVGIAWPRMTLLVLVLVVGTSLLVGGVVQTAASWQVRDRAHGWGWSLAAGALSILGGLVFLFGSPVISVLALALVLACYMLFTGIMLILMALTVRQLARAVLRWTAY